MVHKLVIFWSYYGQNMDHVYIGANHGQNMAHKLVKIWEKYDQQRNGAKYGKNMTKIWCIKWAKYGQYWTKRNGTGFAYLVHV